MAYDKIIPIRRRLDHCLAYAANEQKTDLAAALHYIGNERKTAPPHADRLRTGINCTVETAYAEMQATKRRWNKCGGILGYHIIHSYAPGEVTPQEAHAAGVEFARRLLGERYEAVVATHLDREHFPRSDQSADWSDLDAHVSPPYTVSKGNTPQKPSCDGFLIL